MIFLTLNIIVDDKCINKKNIEIIVLIFIMLIWFNLTWIFTNGCFPFTALAISKMTNSL